MEYETFHRSAPQNDLLFPFFGLEKFHKILFCLNFCCKMTAIVFFVVHGGENISKSFFKISKDKTQSLQRNRRICIQLMWFVGWLIPKFGKFVYKSA